MLRSLQFAFIDRSCRRSTPVACSHCPGPWRAGWRASLTAMVLLVLVTVAAGCGGDSATGPPEEPAELGIRPDAGTPGTVFAITGIVVPAAKVEQTTLIVGGSPSSLTLSPNGQLLGIVPLLAAGTDGGAPPAAPVDVELWQDGVLLARGAGALTVNALAAAPGATADLAAELAALADALRRVSPLLITDPGVEEQWWTAASGALDSLVRGDGPGGLAGAQRELQEQAPATLALLDAYLAGSGVLDRTRMLVAGLRAVAESGPDKTATLTQDVVLARRMQFYVLAKLFGETVVAETAEEFAYVVGMPAGLIGIGADIPAMAVVGAVLAVADFAVNKILLGLLPAELTELTLTLEDTQLLMGEVTTARVDVLARNAPPGVGIQDFVGLMLNVMGVGAGPQTATFAEILEGTAQFYLSTMQQLLSVYSAAHPELGLDISVALVPALEWTATVHDPRLVTRNSFTPDLIAGQPTEVNWRAATNKTGTGAIYTATANGPEALLLDLAPGFTYLGGAFGESVMASATVEIEVTGTLALEIDLPPTIAPDQLVQLDIRAGFVGTEGTGTVWSPGIALSIAASGGSVGDSAGVTGADGTFTTVVELASGSNAVTVSVTATDAGANAVTKSATAFASAATTIRVVDITLVAWCGAGAEVQPPNDGR